MARRPKPWHRKGRGWYVTIDGTQHSLGKKKKEAYEAFYELMRQPRQTKAPEESALAVLDAFLQWTLENRARDTYEWYQKRIQAFAATLPAEVAATTVQPHHVTKWLESKTQCSASYRRGLVIAVKRAFNWAEKQGLIERNNIKHVEKPPASQREQTINEEEYQRLRELANDSAFDDLLVISWETGCRPQESLRVEARHFDELNRRWVFPISESKGKKKPRVVYLNDTAFDLTVKRRAMFSEGPIFRNSKSNPWTPYSVGCRFQRIKKKLGQNYCLYAFRHTFATRMLQSGLDALTVAILLGHSNPAMLSTTYQHLSHNPDFLRKQLERGNGNTSKES